MEMDDSTTVNTMDNMSYQADAAEVMVTDSEIIDSATRRKRKPKTSDDYIFYTNSRDLFSESTTNKTPKKQKLSFTEQSLTCSSQSDFMTGEQMEVDTTSQTDIVGEIDGVTYTFSLELTRKLEELELQAARSVASHSLSVSRTSSSDCEDLKQRALRKFEYALAHSKAIQNLRRSFSTRVQSYENNFRQYPGIDNLEWVSELAQQHRESIDDEEIHEFGLHFLGHISERDLNDFRAQICQRCFATVLNLSTYNEILRKIHLKNTEVNTWQCKSCDSFNH